METPSTLSATGRCKHWLAGDYNGSRGNCPHCEIAALKEWQNDAAGALAQFVILSAHPDEDAWGEVAIVATRLLNQPSNDQAQGEAQGSSRLSPGATGSAARDTEKGN